MKMKNANLFLLQIFIIHLWIGLLSSLFLELNSSIVQQQPLVLLPSGPQLALLLVCFAHPLPPKQGVTCTYVSLLATLRELSVGQ